MGLKDVWGLFPDCTRVLKGSEAIRAAEGRTIAIDAAIWIVEAQTQTSLKKVLDPRCVQRERIGRAVVLPDCLPDCLPACLPD